jgi:hypothetical protein
MRMIKFVPLAMLGALAVVRISTAGAQTMPTAPDALQGGSQPASDQASNTGADQPASTIAPSLPAPDVGLNAPAQDYLHAARTALATGRTGEAQQALEMAQTRLLDRSVPLFQTGTPSIDPAVGKIAAAIKTLGAGDRFRAMQLIDEALALAGEPKEPQ